MLIGYIAYYICRGNLSVALPLLSDAFHYSNTELSYILTFSELAYVLGKFTTGPLADKLGGKRIFLLGLAGAIVFNLVFPFLSTLLMFTLVWCFCRYFLSMGWGGIIKTMGEWYEPERNGRIMGAISINFQFGSVLASVFCGYLIAWGVGWKGLFYYPAFIAIAVLIWAWLASKEGPHEVFPGVKFGKNAGTKKTIAQYANPDSTDRTKTLEIFKTLIKVPLFRQVVVFSVLIHLLRSIFLFWTPKFLVDIGMGNAHAAIMSAVFPFLGCLGTLFIGWYTDKHAQDGNRMHMMTLMLIGLFFCMVVTSVLIPYKMERQAAIVIFLGLSGFFMYGPYSLSAGALSLDIAGAKGAGTCTGIIDGVGYIGGAIATLAAGYISDHGGWAEVFVALSVCAFFTALWTGYMSHSFKK